MVAITRNSAALEIARQSRLSTAIAQGQARIATGDRMARPSDAPADWAAVRRITQSLDSLSAWDFAIGIGQGRAALAQGALNALSEQTTRAQELMILANGPSGQGAGKDAILAELGALRAGISASLAQKDSDGLPVFAAGSALNVPAGVGVNLPSSDALNAVAIVPTPAGNISLDAIIMQAIAAVSSGGGALASASDAVAAAGAHISLQLGRQGLRSSALQSAKEDIAAQRQTLLEARSALADSDIGAEIIQVQQRLTALDATRSSFVRLSQRSLFDLIG
jgi:flagellar hook-associated protein 3 FlgL